MSDPIPVFKPHLRTEAILTALRPVLESGWVGLGPKSKEFEDRFAQKVGTDHAVGVNSATVGLHLALEALGVGPGDEVIVPSLTFISTASVVRYVGAEVVFADIDPQNFCIDPQDVAQKISPKTKAIILVHYGGIPADMAALKALCQEHQIRLIEDCAHAAISEWQGQAVGSIGDIGVFSFHAVKNLPTADGGMMTTNDPQIDSALRKLRWMGIDKDTWKRSAGGGYSWDYHIETLGFKAHINDVTSVIGLVQLDHLDEDNARRQALVKRYRHELTGLDLSWPQEREGDVNCCHNFVVILPESMKDQRDRLADQMKAEGVNTGVHYKPLHTYPFFDDSRVEVPHTDELWLRILTLPLFPQLGDADQDRVLKVFKKTYQAFSS